MPLPASALVLPLLSGETLRVTPLATGAICELYRGSLCITFQRFNDFGGAGSWADKIIRAAAASSPICERNEL